MSLLQHALCETLPRVPARLETLAALIDPAWIEQALAATGKASIRRRKLPADHAVWLVIGLALFRNLPLWQVVQQLALSLDEQALPVPSASVQARQRLGDEPLAHLFGLLTQAWSRPQHSEALRVLAVDGVVWCAPDTPENRQQLGSCRTQHGALPWTQIRAVCLMDTLSHELLDARLGGMDCGELTLATSLQGLDHSLTLFDRAYFSAAFLLQWQGQGVSRHWLMRAKDKLRYEEVALLAPGDSVIRMPVSPQARRQHPELPRHWQARLIEVEVAGQKRRYLTSLMDHQAHPAEVLARLYCERWEIELGFREIKQSLQDAEPVLRSKQPELVRQELWGVLIAYTLLRRWMREMAKHAKVEPRRISFHTASYAILNVLCFASMASASTLPAQLARLLEQSRLFILPPRRPGRHYPRVVKNRAHKYPTKNASQR
ncbi:IS4 family transposase [Crenobacter sp. SG2303]|uniref:IS4 family transposase n=1 Tax=Crenobacter oryzisoli TaxID=3056844 RepID=A0ABT7XS84_9NEIS|nr:IS4 family transposase [Crenobacter sp. SG2303]MDN0076666.1 IS4 family transposase [Crenobacter sp. SG2303]